MEGFTLGELMGELDKDASVEWNLGMWANCPNMGSPVSLGLFVCENKSKYFQKSHPQLRM